MQNKPQIWILTLWFFSRAGGVQRHCVVGPGSIATVEAAIKRAGIEGENADKVRRHELVRQLVEGRLEVGARGHYDTTPGPGAVAIAIGSVGEVVA